MNSQSPSASPRYVIISPVKDEERYIDYTLRSITHQTLKPTLWLIVDDGSTDRTPDIIRSYLSGYSFIRMIRNPYAGCREPGSAIMRAFNYGLQFLNGMNYDFIVKLDCDLSFGADYFEAVVNRFNSDQTLGIASGVYQEIGSDGNWHEIKMPSYHAAGASKVIRRECFEDISGFIDAAGWDTVDEIRAISQGWKTGHFWDLRIKHHKAEGSGIGALKTSAMHGEIYYRIGGSRLFFILKVFHRLSAKPYLLGAIALLKGYLSAKVKGKALLVTDHEAKCYRALLFERLQKQVKALFPYLLNPSKKK